MAGSGKPGPAFIVPRRQPPITLRKPPATSPALLQPESCPMQRTLYSYRYQFFKEIYLGLPTLRKTP